MSKLHPTDFYCVFLRRYAPSKGKPEVDASVMIGLIETKDEPINGPDASFNDHPSWPQKALNGYEFTEEDAKVVLYIRLFKRSDNGQLTTLKGDPTGEIVECKKHCKKHK